MIDQPAPYVDGIPYLGIHANAQNSDIVDCDTAPAYQEAWHVLKGKGIPQPVTFSPDGETVYATSTNAEEDGCRVWALDGRTGETNWCETYDRDVAASSVEVDLDGHLYFTAARRVISLNADGTERWSTPLEEGSLEVDVVVGSVWGSLHARWPRRNDHGGGCRVSPRPRNRRGPRQPRSARGLRLRAVDVARQWL